MRMIRPSRHIVCGFALALAFLSQPLISQSPPSPQPSRSSAKRESSSNQGKVNCTNTGTYVNSRGQTVKRPENCSGPPQAAAAQCRDGTYSFSRSRRGTCSHHGGVAKWFSDGS